MKKIIAFAMAMIMAASLCVSASARLVGDVDSSGKVNSTDALLVLKYTVGIEKTINTKYADVNNDGKVNSSDALDILKICVGLYKGDLEVNDDTLKSSIVDKVMKTKKFTVVTTVEESGETIPVKIMIDGNNMATELTYSGVTMRILVLNGQTYCVIPNFLGSSVYGRLVGEDLIPDFGEFGVISGLQFIKSEKVTKSGKTYTVETYKLAGKNEYSYTEYKYYFLNNEWKILETINYVNTLKDGKRVWTSTTDTQTIDSFKAGVDSSYFKLTGKNIGDIDMGKL